ncbi:aspartic proteinase nepenthesin-1-like [Oryza brachyantha]|uniref:Peptidase A1 domain-containing protein n=1 Tax=Oryza brachyantha TaxID=4533 RepID=J3MLK5_ORYBR|nr:aspartic proteinase nepenthesin-1-like [Oryza brachyantha]
MASTGAAAILGLILLLLPPITLAGDDLRGFRATLTRIHKLSPGNHSEAVRRDSHRLSFLSYATAVGKASNSSSSVSIKALIENGAVSYHMNLSMGTPPVTFPAMIDTGSDLIWTQCAACTKCFKQPTPLFEPARSSTFSKLPCNSSFCQSLPTSFRTCNATGCVYNYRYGVGYTAGYLATEKLTVGDASFRNVAFGCSTANEGTRDNASGLVGLGRTPLSLVSQLGVGRFSYCLRSYKDAGDSPILFGSLAKLTGANVQSTPLLRHPDMPDSSTWYYVNLTGITVGSTDVPVTSSTFGFTQTGLGGGTIVDSGTTYTYLAKDGYAMVKQAFLSQMANLKALNGTRFGLDLCFLPSGGDVPVAVPSLVLRFAGGAEYVVPRDNYLADLVDSRQGNVVGACLLVLPAKDGWSISIIGNRMQMGMHVLYDLDGEKFSFAPADCAKV